ncbi:MAG: tocopherol cyclase family protein [Eubacteriales bacterium]|nr:tocopherol cyclase family protein [Eubacteriales bacterium]
MHGSFYGWYLKCQSDSQTLAVIPAIHRTGRNQTCSIQIITDTGTWAIPFSADAFHREKKNLILAGNRFGEDGISLAIHTPELEAQGRLDFGPLTPLKYDIMGPFSLVPFMECRHSVWSMQHSVCGTVSINGQEYSFSNGRGYWEGDRGRSFPKKYLWTQCSFPEGSLMLSAADIPIAGIHFTGIIGAILWEGREYRMATYLGAKIVELQNQKIRVAQGDLEMEACLLEASDHPLKAPTEGDMVRTIHESASCRAFYQFRKRERTLFAFETEQASFEYEYPSCHPS